MRFLNTLPKHHDMKKIILPVLLLASLHCTHKTENISQADLKTDTLPTAAASGVKIFNEEKLLQLNTEMLNLLAEKKYEEIANYIHPVKGVTISMYGTLKPDENTHLSANDFRDLLKSGEVRMWGEKDGSGERYEASLQDFLENWLFARDYREGTVSIDTVRAQGNSLNNMKMIFPESHFTENYIPGTELYGGLDWNALRFVFEDYNGKPYLVGIISDRWTI